MAKSSSKSPPVLERLLEERRQYEAWLARLDAAGDATPDHVRVRVRADYQARLDAVTKDLKAHAAQAQEMIAEKRDRLTQLARKEKECTDRLKESELRHAVGEYDETEWKQVHRAAQAELIAIREELKGVRSDIAKLEELDGIAGGNRTAAPVRNDERKKAPLDELAFLKSVTEDDDSGPSPRRASGAHFQPAVPDMLPAPRADDSALDGEKTLKCKECGTLNLPTEWYCEQCGSELAAV